jgi:hypothetical protein
MISFLHLHYFAVNFAVLIKSSAEETQYKNFNLILTICNKKDFVVSYGASMLYDISPSPDYYVRVL